MQESDLQIIYTYSSGDAKLLQHYPGDILDAYLRQYGMTTFFDSPPSINVLVDLMAFCDLHDRVEPMQKLLCQIIRGNPNRLDTLVEAGVIEYCQHHWPSTAALLTQIVEDLPEQFMIKLLQDEELSQKIMQDCIAGNDEALQLLSFFSNITNASQKFTNFLVGEYPFTKSGQWITAIDFAHSDFSYAQILISHPETKRFIENKEISHHNVAIIGAIMATGVATTLEQPILRHVAEFAKEALVAGLYAADARDIVLSLCYDESSVEQVLSLNLVEVLLQNVEISFREKRQITQILKRILWFANNACFVWVFGQNTVRDLLFEYYLSCRDGIFLLNLLHRLEENKISDEGELFWTQFYIGMAELGMREEMACLPILDIVQIFLNEGVSLDDILNFL